MQGKNRINWKRNNLAIDCDFPGEDFKTETTESYNECLNRCVLFPNCTHFVWFNKTCHTRLKHVRKEMAIPKLGAFCGIVTPLGLNKILLISIKLNFIGKV